MKICKFLSGSNYSEKEIYSIELCAGLEQNCVCSQQVNIVICRHPTPLFPQKKLKFFKYLVLFVAKLPHTVNKSAENMF